MATLLGKVKRKQAKRSIKAKKADAAQTAKRKVSAINKKGLKEWLRDPSLMDVLGIDTKKKTKKKRKK